MNILRKWYRWKYSGLITVPLICGLILLAWFSYMETLEFYDAFSCDGLVTYKVVGEKLGDNPSYNDMTVENKLHYDEILADCKVDGYWIHDGQPVTGSELAILQNRG